jgi:hypothetical protein
MDGVLLIPITNLCCAYVRFEIPTSSADWAHVGAESASWSGGHISNRMNERRWNLAAFCFGMAVGFTAAGLMVGRLWVDRGK